MREGEVATFDPEFPGGGDGREDDEAGVGDCDCVCAVCGFMDGPDAGAVVAGEEILECLDDWVDLLDMLLLIITKKRRR